MLSVNWRSRNVTATLVAVALLLAANYLAVNLATSCSQVRRVIEYEAGKELCAQVRIDRAAVSLLGRVVLRGGEVIVGGRSERRLALFCPEASANITLGSLFEGRVIFRRMTFKRPVIFLESRAGHWNVEPVIMGLSPKGKGRGGFPLVAGGKIVVEQAEVRVRQKSLTPDDGAHVIRNLSFVGEMTEDFKGRIEITGKLDDPALGEHRIAGALDTIAGNWEFRGSSEPIAISAGLATQIPLVGSVLLNEYGAAGMVSVEDAAISFRKGGRVKYAMRLGVRDGYLSPSAMPVHVSQIAGRILLGPEGVRLDKLGGRVVLGGVAGSVEVDGPIGSRNPQDFLSLTANRISFSPDIVKSIPSAGTYIWNSYEPSGLAGISLRLASGGNMEMKELHVLFEDCAGTRIDGVKLPAPLKTVSGTLDMRDGMVVIQNMQSRWGGGHAEGMLRFRTPGFVEPTGGFSISGVDLAAVGPALGLQTIRGRADGDVRFRGDDPSRLGDGRLEIREGYLLKMPTLLALLSILKIQPPDFGEGFDDATIASLCTNRR